eukprot:3748577-Rhodomonas_salina.2
MHASYRVQAAVWCQLESSKRKVGHTCQYPLRLRRAAEVTRTMRRRTMTAYHHLNSELNVLKSAFNATVPTCSRVFRQGKLSYGVCATLKWPWLWICSAT